LIKTHPGYVKKKIEKIRIFFALTLVGKMYYMTLQRISVEVEGAGRDNLPF